ncbi:MAG TPA: FAD-binding protein [Pseudonocardiaceae bacterium]|nr:FAD-binding protein [Pseudonocardiaceae bacterium]
MAFDPVTRTWVGRESPAAVLVPELAGQLVYDESRLRWAAEDFGHVIHHRPRAVLRPGEIADVAAIVEFAAKAGLTVAAHGGGHSTYGQAQTSGGIVIDTAELNLVGGVRADRVTAQAGARWSDVLDTTLAGGCTPAVLTDYLGTSVGGTLSVGGVGGTSHQHGFQVDSVEELSVVTGTGQLVTCSRQQNRRLFDATRAGLGQCGIIVSATLRVIPAAARARRYRLYYFDLTTFLAAQHQLVNQGKFDFLQGQIVLAAPGVWRYLLEAAVYYTPPVAPVDATLLDGLDYHCAEKEIDDIAYREFAHRMAPGEAALRDSGEWNYSHPWLTVLLPTQATATLVGEVLAELTAAELGQSGLVLLYPLRTDRLHTPMTRSPDSQLAWLFGLLRTASVDDPADVAAMTEANRTILDRALACGGVTYPINAVPMSPADWRTHFGPRWRQLQAAKQEFDPHGILTPGYGIGTPPAAQSLKPVH